MKLKVIKKTACLFVAMLVIVFSSCSENITTDNAEKQNAIVFAMDTVMDLTIYGKKELLTNAETIIIEIEDRLSVTKETSEIYALNHNTSNRLCDKTISLLNRALELCALTDGALDITIYPILQVWGFTTDNYRVPDENEISELLKVVDYKKIEISLDNIVTLANEAAIDFGSIAKGYTGDTLISMLKENGVTSALLNLGGNVQALGAKPDGTNWKIALKNPTGNGYVGSLQIADCAVITSGGYERYFEKDGKSYCHIIDPFTGYPVENGILSVTIIGQNGAMSDALSTALFVMGKDKAIEFWKTQNNFDAIIITDDEKMYITEGLENSFSPSSSYAKTNIEVLRND